MQEELHFAVVSNKNLTQYVYDREGAEGLEGCGKEEGRKGKCCFVNFVQV